MLNEEIARIFERMARGLASKGEDRFRIMAYERAAVSIRDLEEDLASIAEQGRLEDIPGQVRQDVLQSGGQTVCRQARFLLDQSRRARDPAVLVGIIGVRVLRDLHITMQQAGIEEGTRVPEHVEVRAEAKILFVKSLMIDRVLAYSEYRLAEPSVLVMPDNSQKATVTQEATVIMRTAKRLLQDALTLAALLCLTVSAFCPTQTTDRFDLSVHAVEAERLIGVDAQEVASPKTAIVGDALPGVALPDATLQDPALPSAPLVDAVPQEEPTKNTATPCLEPPPLLRWQDYDGPFLKLVGAFAGKTGTQISASSAYYKPGAVLWPLEVKDKFMLFVRDTFDPISFFEAGFNAGLDQVSNWDHAFGHCAEGYGRRFGADFTGQTTWRFFTDFACDLLRGP